MRTRPRSSSRRLTAVLAVAVAALASACGAADPVGSAALAPPADAAATLDRTAHLPIHVPIAQFSTVVLARPEVVGSANLVVQDIGKLDLRAVGVTKP